MINHLFLHPLGPTLILALGGLLLMMGRRLSRGPIWARPRVARALRQAPRGVHRPFALLMLLATGASMLLLRVPSPAATNLRWVWQPLTVAGSALSWQLDGWNWLLALIFVLLSGVALLIAEPAADTDYERSLWLAAAAMAFVFSGNVVTLASCWVLLDATLALRLHPVRGSQMAAQVWGVLSLAGMLVFVVLVLQGEAGSRTTLINGRFAGLEFSLLWLAGLIRAGVYPLHLWLMTPAPHDEGDRITLHLIPALAGLWLLGRAYGLADAAWLRGPQWIGLGALALLGSALAAWTSENGALRWRWIAINRASLALLAAYAGGAAGPETLAWTVILFGLACGLLAVGQAMRQRLGWSWPIWLSVLMLWGAPGTPGFLARSAVIFPTGSLVAVPVFGVILIAEILLVASLWQIARGGDSDFKINDSSKGAPSVNWRMSGRLGLAALLLVVPLVAWGLAPRMLAVLAQLPPGEKFPSLLGSLSSARRSIWFGLVVSGGLGVWIGLQRQVIFSRMRGWQRGISRVAGLEWAYGAGAGLLAALGNGLRYFAALGEGAGYLGWLALAVLILWVLLRG